MIKELIGELLRSGIGRVSLTMFVLLAGTALYVIFTFPADFGRNV